MESTYPAGSPGKVERLELVNVNVPVENRENSAPGQERG